MDARRRALVVKVVAVAAGGALAVGLAGVAPRSALAQAARPPSAAGDAARDRDRARRLADEGARLLDAGDARGALAKLRDADAAFPAPTIKAAIAEAHEKLGELIEARDVYRGVAGAPLPAGASREFQDARDAAARAAARIDKAIPRILLVLRGEAPVAMSLSLDGAAVAAPAWSEPLPVNPGEHALTVEMAGRAPQTLRVSVREGETRRVEIRGVDGDAAVVGAPATAAGAGADAGRRSMVAPAVVFGVAGAGLVAGAITGGITLAKMGEFRARCGAELRCPASFEGELDTAKAVGHASTVAFAVAGAAAAVGVALVVWPSGGGAGAGGGAGRGRVEARLGPMGLEVSGRF